MDQVHDGKVAKGVHRLGAEVNQALDGHAYNQAPMGKIRSNIIDKLLDEHVYGDMLAQAYRTLCYNPDTPPFSLLDVHINTHLPQNNIRTLHTTNIQAYVVNCTHARIHKHLLSYKVREANVYKQLLIVPVLEDVWGVVLVVGNLVRRAWYVLEDNEGVQGDSLQQ